MRKLVLSFELPTMVDDILKTTSVSFLNFEVVNLIVLHLNYYIESFYKYLG